MKCAIYCRVSTSKQGKQYSLPTQIQEGLEFVKSKGWDFQIYQEAESGTSIENRSQFDQLMKDIENKVITKIWVIDNDRLNRNVVDSSIFAKLIKKTGAELFVRDTMQDLATPAGRLAYNVISATSEFNRDHIIESSIRGKTEWQNQGRMVVPYLYGYKNALNEDGKKILIIDEKETEVIRLIFKLYNEDLYTLNKIALHLNDLGLKTKKGFLWTRPQVQKILIQTMYIGQAWDTEGNPIKSKVYQRIIEDEVFYKAAKIIKDTKKTRVTFAGRSPVYELSTIIRCAKCGAAYFYNCNQKTNKAGMIKKWERYYHAQNVSKYKSCTQSPKFISKKYIELEIANLVRTEFLENDEKLEQWYSKHKTDSEKNKELIELEISVLEENKEKVISKKDKIIESIGEGIISKEDAKNTLTRINDELASIDLKIKEKKVLIEELKIEINDEAYKSIIQLVLDFDSISTLQKRRLYQSIFKKVEIDGYKITVIMWDDSIRRILLPGYRKEKK